MSDIDERFRHLPRWNEVERLQGEIERLRASNTELLAALKALQIQALQSNVNDGNDWGREALGMTRAAIEKAEGH